MTIGNIVCSQGFKVDSDNPTKPDSTKNPVLYFRHHFSPSIRGGVSEKMGRI